MPAYELSIPVTDVLLGAQSGRIPILVSGDAFKACWTPSMHFLFRIPHRLWLYMYIKTGGGGGRDRFYGTQGHRDQSIRLPLPGHFRVNLKNTIFSWLKSINMLLIVKMEAASTSGT